MRVQSRWSDDSGVALITALLVVMLITGLMAGMFAAIQSDQRSAATDRDQTQVYAAAHAGLEKLTSSLAVLFVTDVSPSVAQINTVAATPPVLSGFDYKSPGGTSGSGYAITFTPNPGPGPNTGNPMSFPDAPITTGPFTGFRGIITPYTVTVTAVSNGGSEVRLRRELQTVAVPVFQFGVFSESDLTFYAGDSFNFGGRVHTNGNLFLCNFVNSLTLADRVTAFREVVRNFYANSLATTTTGCTGNVNILTAPGVYRNLRQSPNEGSVTGMPGSSANTNWTSLSVGTYKSYIRTGLTGAKVLNLPLVSQGAVPIDLIRRPLLNSNENTAAAAVYGQRYYAQASLRILLSDRVADFTGLPTITAAPPVLLDGDWTAAPPNNGIGAYGPVSATNPPVALSAGLTPALTTVAAGSSAATINVTGGVPAWLKIPATITVGANAAVTCTGKTANTFTGCVGIAVAVPDASVVSTNALAYPAGEAAQTTTSGALAIGATTITVVANGTSQFSQGSRVVWVNGNAVTCTGYIATQLQGCAGYAPSTGDMISTQVLSNQGQGLLGGYIKVESTTDGITWSDVTMEMLNLGIAARNSQGWLCNDPTPDAVLRLQRLRDNSHGTVCTYNGTTRSTDFWPNALFDTREADFRNLVTTAPMNLGGVMHYVALDVGNLKRWLAGTIGTTGATALNSNGYIVYFSDRRGDHNETGATVDQETAEYGFEDVVNPASATGAQDGTLQTGEDLNGSGALDVYGETPSAVAGVIPTFTANAVILNADPYSLNGRPWTVIPAANAGIARVNRSVLFRRALKIVNGGISGGVNNLPTAGLTIASENPVYVQGNYNATEVTPTANWANQEPNVPSSIIADSVTLLSRVWRDDLSFRFPNAPASRPAATTGYRFAVIAGKGLSFPHPGAPGGNPHFLFGTDGGVGNFLRLLEHWNAGGVAINYRGSIISLFHSRQGTGTFKWGDNVYTFGVRNFTFDDDFLTAALLPPGTPMFRDVNTLKFRQILRPNQ
jgi:hypothetical protein